MGSKGGAAVLTCRMPVVAQRATNHGSDEAQPKAMLTHAVSARPVASIVRGERTSPTTPETNLEQPYVRGKTEEITPMDVMSTPSSGEATIAGAV